MMKTLRGRPPPAWGQNSRRTRAPPPPPATAEPFPWGTRADAPQAASRRAAVLLDHEQPRQDLSRSPQRAHLVELLTAPAEDGVRVVATLHLGADGLELFSPGAGRNAELRNAARLHDLAAGAPHADDE